MCFHLSLAASQGSELSAVDWQEQVRKYAQAQNWNAALQVVDREIVQAPKDMDVRGWRARVLLWAGRLTESEQTYREILSISAADPDNWLGLANVYSREGRMAEAAKALDRAAALDPSRPDIHVARARALRTIGRRAEANAEFRRALELDANNEEARQGLRAVRRIPKHEVRVASNTDLFSFANANHNAGVTVISHWTPRWGSMAAAEFYRWAGMGAEKLTVTMTGRFDKWGSVTVGGATANDNGVIPRDEALVGYGQGWKLSSDGRVRGLEADYEQHWYWYSTARILTVNELLIFYLPDEWTCSFRLTGARSQFTGPAAEWRPSGLVKLGFPLVAGEERLLTGNLLFGTGTENFAQADQIGRFSSQTYGGTLRFQFTPSQDISGIAAYQKRTQGRMETSFGFSYGVRF